ncbi:WD40 repeat-like protein [Lophiostoma macrostomum CBS 122681]|uniref:methylated diphthine methylhydrolase n=1 Tax=Lophiostoma macrostomum CBS 122681 TaxID=1314788 RepID=A0A6A6TL59_9PLEO|nr:WD40 repeat-like protein [Lophiostoma macrostomum CBS 122681]
MSSIKSLDTVILDLPPSCIEFDRRHPEYAIVGTYNLEKSSEEDNIARNDDASTIGEAKTPQSRNGSLILIKVSGDEVKLILTHSTPSAILDIHFAPNSPEFGVATSTGSVDIYTLNFDSPDSPQIIHSRCLQYFPTDVLVTAFSWNWTGSYLAMTLSDGRVCLGSSRSAERWLCLGAHDLEAWTLAFTPDGKSIFSGGDDSALKYWKDTSILWNYSRLKTRAENEDKGEKVATWSVNRVHGAGVTAILPIESSDKQDENVVLTGSYDDHIRLVHAPPSGRRSVLTEMNLGGGVWRIKQLGTDNAHKTYSADFLVSCMHAGTRIVRLSRHEVDSGSEWRFEVLAKFEEHKSMNYGSDYQEPQGDRKERTFVTTSFYDRLLCLWRF